MTAPTQQKLTYEHQSKKSMSGFFPDTDNEMHGIIAPGGKVFNKTDYDLIPPAQRPGGIALNKKQLDAYVQAAVDGETPDPYMFFDIRNPAEDVTGMDAAQQKDPYSGTFNMSSGEVYGGAPRPGDEGDKMRLDQAQVDEYGWQVEQAWNAGQEPAVDPWSLYKVKRQNTKMRK